jgi:hypothetical protein
MTEANGEKRYYNCQWAQEDVKTSYNLLIIIIVINVKTSSCKVPVTPVGF